MHASSPPPASSLCREWIGRWLPITPGLFAPEALATVDLDPLHCALAWVDCAVRVIVPLALEAQDLPGQAAALRRLAPIESEEAGRAAMLRLDLAAETAAAVSPRHHFCAAARLAVQEAIVLLVATQHGASGMNEPTRRLQSLFSESGALDMVIQRSILAGVSRDEVLAPLHACLAQLLESARAEGVAATRMAPATNPAISERRLISRHPPLAPDSQPRSR